MLFCIKYYKKHNELFCELYSVNFGAHFFLRTHVFLSHHLLTRLENLTVSVIMLNNNVSLLILNVWMYNNGIAPEMTEVLYFYIY